MPNLLRWWMPSIELGAVGVALAERAVQIVASQTTKQKEEGMTATGKLLGTS